MPVTLQTDVRPSLAPSSCVYKSKFYIFTESLEALCLGAYLPSEDAPVSRIEQTLATSKPNSKHAVLRWHVAVATYIDCKNVQLFSFPIFSTFERTNMEENGGKSHTRNKTQIITIIQIIDE